VERTTNNQTQTDIYIYIYSADTMTRSTPTHEDTSLKARLSRKRHDLMKLMQHASTLPVDARGEAMNVVLTRLLTEIRRIEVQEMRLHLQSCEGLSSEFTGANGDGYALGHGHGDVLRDTALPALEEALRHIDANGDMLEAGRMTNAALIQSMPLFGRMNGNGIAHSSNNDSNGGAGVPANVSIVQEELRNMNLLRNDSNDSPDSSITDMNIIKSEPEDMKMNMKIKSSPKKGKGKKNASIKKSSYVNKSPLWYRLITGFLRCLFLDLPLATTCLFLVSSYAGVHIYTNYWVPILDALQWTEERSSTEYTNYMRECDAEDVSTLNSDDFIIDPNSTTAQEAVDITNKHGMSIYPNLLSPETSANMRDYVLRKNAALTKDDAIWLIANKNRWSFAIGADDDPAVAPVLQEVATNPSFQAAIEGLMGENPAMVEFTAITSGYGATDQHWHADTEYGASSMHYARSFVPMYSLFIPLQDTTAQMGATSACPGTHLCGEESKLTHVCDGHNFQVEDSRGRLAQSSEDHIWKAGDGFLLHLNTYHRGPGHTDPNGAERVMLILTISNRPKGPNFDRRQISLGTSYSLKWDMFGLTMKDLAIMDKIKGFPWKQLRTLGVYKPLSWGKDYQEYAHSSKATLWGWDYFTVMSSRINQEGFGFRSDDIEVLSEYVKRKGGSFMHYLFGYIPEDIDDLEEEVIGGSWRAYFVETGNRCIRVSYVAFGVSWVVYLLGSLMQRKKVASMVRGVKITAFVVILGLLAIRRLSTSPWGQDITNGHISDSVFVAPEEEFELGETVIPKSKDILLSTRLDSPDLAGQNYIYKQQPGNAHYYNLLATYSGSFKKTPSPIQKEIIDIVLDATKKENRRFLLQNPFGDWQIQKDEDIMPKIERALVAESNPITKSLRQEVKYAISDCLHGKHRKTVISRKHGLANISSLDNKLFGVDKVNHDSLPLRMVPTMRPSKLFEPSIRNLRSAHNDKSANALKNDNKVKQKDSTKSKDFKVGDIVESYFEPDGWFKGVVSHIKTRSKKSIGVAFDDGDFQYQKKRDVRHYSTWAVGDLVLVTVDGEMETGTIVNIRAIGQYVLELDESNEGWIAYADELSRFE